MTFDEVRSYLKENGTAQNRKVYLRHGASEPLYGVSFAHLNQLQKKIKVDHPLALKLWNTGNMDCRTLALKIADPESLNSVLAETWVRESNYKVLAGELADLVSRSSLADKKMNKWMKSKQECIRKCGYDLLSCRLKEGWKPETSLVAQVIQTIERQVHGSPHLARHSMVMALIAIGIYLPPMEAEVLASSERIGSVHVDHGKTGCKTPEIAPYIKRARKRQKKS